MYIKVRASNNFFCLLKKMFLTVQVYLKNYQKGMVRVMSNKLNSIILINLIYILS